MTAWAPAPGGLRVLVRVTPRGGRDGLDGGETLSDGRQVLKLRVRALASEGAANDAVCALMADLLDLAKRDVTLAGGGKARIKTLAIAGSATALAAQLTKLLETTAPAA